ncbi:MAG: amidase family protein [Gemmatimonadota bacterium]|nr:amidase family protein [Gemmatimonadota bacterium]
MPALPRSAALLACGACFAAPLAAQGAPLDISQTTIAQLQAGYRDDMLTCRTVVERSLAQIEAHDKRGIGLNAIILTNPEALAIADSLDRRFRVGGPVGPLHCVPMIIKDNFDTQGLQTAAGSLSLQGHVPATDAFQVTRIKAAGAIVLAKSNMAEFAFSPLETVGSLLPGYTRNPYDPSRVTAGSSGGTAAAVAAGYGTVGLGTDTGNSIRGPSSHQALVGIRSTMGLTSRAGVIPLSMAADIAGPMARSVADAVAVFQVIVGSDPADPVTAEADAHVQLDYASALRADGLRGARIAVLNQAWERPSTDPEVRAVFQQAVADLRRAGATVLDSIPLPGYDSLSRTSRGCNRFKHDMDAYLAEHPTAPLKSVAEILRSGRFHPSVQVRLQSAAAVDSTPDRDPGCQARKRYAEGLRELVTRQMDALQLDALVYPTWSNAPRLIGDLNTPGGDNSQVFSPATGFPAVNVPMGWLREGKLPTGMTFFGRAWSEPVLFRLAYAYEQATLHRRAPVLGR